MKNPLTVIFFSNPTAKILDQIRLIGKTKVSIKELRESSETNYSSAHRAIRHLVELGILKKTKEHRWQKGVQRTGNWVTLYEFDVELCQDLIKFMDAMNQKLNGEVHA